MNIPTVHSHVYQLTAQRVEQPGTLYEARSGQTLTGADRMACEGVA